jgi:hypothetical protein
MEPEVKQAKATLLNYLLKEKEEMSRDDHKAVIRKTDFYNLIKEIEDGLKTTKDEEHGTTGK